MLVHSTTCLSVKIIQLCRLVEQSYYWPASKNNVHTPLTTEKIDGVDADKFSESSETSDYVEMN